MAHKVFTEWVFILISDQMFALGKFSNDEIQAWDNNYPEDCSEKHPAQGRGTDGSVPNSSGSGSDDKWNQTCDKGEEVMRIGRNRTLAPSMAASSTVDPC